MKFSVLMAVCAKDNPSHLAQALQSLADQTLKADEVVLVEDGPVSAEVQSVIERYRKELKINSVKLEQNHGLAMALNKGLQQCTHELVARMDSDDIALSRRFERQVAFMRENPDLSVISAWIEEFDQSMGHSQDIRKVPQVHGEILRFAKRRNPMNHPVSIFRKGAVLSVGGYPLFRKAQDYALWSLMLQRGHKMANIPEVLLHMRTGSAFLDRRGFSYFKQEVALLRYQKQIGFLSWKDLLINIAIRSAVRLPPDPVKRMLYRLAR
jgi:glycosyltransferase involved in cell wall biosynthesis